MTPLSRVALCLILAAPLLAGTKGRVCFLDSADACADSGRVISIEPAEKARTFVWTDDKSAEVVFGTVPAGATKIDADSGAVRKVFVSIAGAAADVPVTLRLSSNDRTWAWAIADPTSLRLVRAPRDISRLVIEAPRHRPLEFAIAEGEKVVLGQAQLQRYDTLAGRVVQSGTDNPVIGARIEASDGAVIADTDANGAFDVDIDAQLAGKWPAALHVRAPARGTKVLPLPSNPQSRRWDRIELSQGGGVRIAIDDREKAIAGDVAIELRRHRGGAPDAWETVARAAVDPSEGPVVFEDLDAGSYVLLGSGKTPTEQIAVDIEVKAGETTDAKLDIRPVKVRISVEHSGEPIAGAKVAIDFRNRWTAAVTTAAEPQEATFWQRGSLFAFASLPGRGSFSSRKTIESDGDADWRIVIPDRTLQGVVRERGSRKPVAGATVILDRGSSKRVVRTDSAGAFTFDFLTPGAVTLRYLANDNYLAAAVEVTLLESDRLRRADLEVSPAILTKVRFVSPSGAPAANAKVYDPVQPDIAFQTDAAGELVLRLGAEETRRVFIVPWKGAFSVANVTARADTVVQLPDGPATLTLTATEEGGKPISGIWFRGRFNGQELPPTVLEWIAARDGAPLATGSDGTTILTGMPLGLYELWPVQRQQAGKPAASAPIRLAAQPGDNPVRLTFTRW